MARQNNSISKESASANGGQPTNPPRRGKPFAKGNGGRKPGSQNRTTQIAAALMEGQANSLVQKGVALALEGNVPMLKVFLDRLLPKEPPIQLNLPPLRMASDAVEALAIIAREIAEGKISPSQGAAAASVVDRFIRALEVTEHEKLTIDVQQELKGIFES
jgi:hypothetical protein